MVDLKSIVDEFAQQYAARRDTVPNINTLEGELYSMAGIKPTEPHAFVLMDMDSPYLHHVGSSCGCVGNKIFQNTEIINFLKERGVEYILGMIYEPKDMDFSDNSITVDSIALPIPYAEGYKFERLVERKNGSFRCESSKVKGWTVYESE